MNCLLIFLHQPFLLQSEVYQNDASSRGIVPLPNTESQQRPETPTYTNRAADSLGVKSIGPVTNIEKLQHQNANCLGKYCETLPLRVKHLLMCP